MGILKSKGLSFAKAYEVSRVSLSQSLGKNKSIKMVFDVHRDRSADALAEIIKELIGNK